jgi:hypothetical protein
MSGPFNIRELGPRVQRAIEGVVQQNWELNPDEVKDVTADACADILLYTGSVFGSQLVILSRDGVTNAPTEYATDSELSPAQASVIAAQAALTYFYHRFSGQKMSEQISDEASHWEYSLSPNLLIAQLKLLQDTRDKALEAVSAMSGGLDQYVSFLGVRDNLVSRYIEPWVYGHSEGLGIGAGGQESDFSWNEGIVTGADVFVP